MSHSKQNHLPRSEVIVVGAGVSGLRCAGLLRESGLDVRVIEKSRGVGGRCATRRVDGQPVDHGLAFYHGDDLGFLSALRSVASGRTEPWPRTVAGEGAPCQPRALRPDQHRIAFAEGVSAFPKSLARGIPIDLETKVTGIDSHGPDLVLNTMGGPTVRARTVVLALPPGQILELIRSVRAPESSDLASIAALLAGVSMVRCLTVIAGYAPTTPLPGWDVCYPGESDILQMVTQDSTKRPAPAPPVFVLQARPRWSAEYWDDDRGDWARELLLAARGVCGDWVTEPSWTDTHRWRFARLTGGDALSEPPIVRLENGCRIGITGEATIDGGGVQAAWRSGGRMANRLLEERQG